MKDLHIIDVYAHIWTGSVNTRAAIYGPVIKTESGYRERKIPSGGIAFLFNKLYDLQFENYVVFVADRYPAYKKQILLRYKEQRSFNESVNLQKQVAEHILDKIGIGFHAVEGYEADDIIYTLVDKYHSDFDSVYVYADDSDMSICVNDNTSLRKVKSTGKNITRENYEYTAYTAREIPYNSIAVQKIMYGDTADNIPRLDKHIAQRVANCTLGETQNYLLGKRVFVEGLIKTFVPEATQQFEAVFPFLLNDLGTPPKVSINRDLLNSWGAAIGNRKFRPSVNIDADIAALFELGLYED